MRAAALFYRRPPGLALLAFAAAAAASCGRAEERGRQLYAAHGCAVCHGAAGRGDGATAKRLDVPPRDFADRRSYRQGAARDAVARSIREGTPGGAMPPFPDITEEEASDIAAWIVSLQTTADSGREP